MASAVQETTKNVKNHQPYPLNGVVPTFLSCPLGLRIVLKPDSLLQQQQRKHEYVDIFPFSKVMKSEVSVWTLQCILIEPCPCGCDPPFCMVPTLVVAYYSV